jgi:hypothetical protein
MLVFVDESGDTGRKLEKGSSRYFIISLILFADKDEATACDQRISLLRRELGRDDKFEFHFAHNSQNIREKFLTAVAPYNFMYFSIVIDKNPNLLWGNGFNDKESFYKYVCNLVFTNAINYIDSAIVVLDKSGSPIFRKRLKTYLAKNLLKDGKSILHKLKQQDSAQNNLLQLADYVSGIVNRKIQDKKDWQELYRFVSSKEMHCQIWPKSQK